MSEESPTLPYEVKVFKGGEEGKNAKGHNNTIANK
jgi:hypothetical protein